MLSYYDSSYPLSPESYAVILNSQTSSLQHIRQLSSQLDDLHHVSDPKIFSQQWKEFLLQLSALMKDADAKSVIDNSLESIYMLNRCLLIFTDSLKG